MAGRRTAEQRAFESKVEDAIRQVLKVSSIGRKILKACPFDESFDKIYGQNRIEEQAKAHGLNPDLARKARQLADGHRGYTEDELDALFDLCRDKKYVLGVSIVHKFLTVPKSNGRRAAFQEEAITGKWTRGASPPSYDGGLVHVDKGGRGRRSHRT